MTIKGLLFLIGGLSIFLFGMKTMSEALQQVAGEKLKNLLVGMTRNRWAGILSGLVSTATIQSSSATTVMVVGLVNAGLLSTLQAVGVIMGANIGTTITAWMVALLGFKVKISLLALIASTVGMTLMFLKRGRFQGWSYVLLGFAFIFLGLQFMKDAVPDGAKDPEAFAWLRTYADMGFLSIFIFVGIGTVLTILVQSSSAATTITLMLAYSGHIPLEASLAMVLGENIGTTITANLAALAGNANAKKAALAHTLFNIIGVTWAIALFFPFSAAIRWAIPGSGTGDIEVTRFQISAFHTTFNILNTLIMVWFSKIIATSASSIVDYFSGKKSKPRSRLGRFLDAGPVGTVELATVELSNFSNAVIEKGLENLNVLESLLNKFTPGRMQKLRKSEDKLDRQRTEAISFLHEVLEAGISGTGALEATVQVEQVKAMEELADQYALVGEKLRRANKDKVSLSPERKTDIQTMFAIIQQQRDSILDKKGETFTAHDIQESRKLRDGFLSKYRKLESNIGREKKAGKKGLLGVILFTDVLHSLDGISRSLHRIVVAREAA